MFGEAIFSENKYVLGPRDIDCMYNIINLNISIEEKAIKLCQIYYCYNKNRYHIKVFVSDGFSNEYNSKYEYIKNYLNNLEVNGYFSDNCYSKYGLTSMELEDKIYKLNKIYLQFRDCQNDYKNVYTFLTFFKNTKDFLNNYKLIIKYGQDDKRLNKIKEGLNYFDNIISKLNEYEKSGIMKDVMYLNRINAYFKTYDYSAFIINSYIFSNYKLNEFLDLYGLSKENFECVLEVIREINPILYKKYLEETKIKEQENINLCNQNISLISKGITLGYIENEEFNVVSFLKLFPFKTSTNPIKTMKEYLRKNNPSLYNIVINYMIENELTNKDLYKPLDIDKLYEIKTCVNGKLITSEDIDFIITYMVENDIPLINKTYIFIRKRYLEDGLMLKKRENSKLKSKKITLIPSSRK